VSIVRIGLSETKHFADGYDAIFSKKTRTPGRTGKSAARSRSTKKKGKRKKR
jgi:hypothetical protein